MAVGDRERAGELATEQGASSRRCFSAKDVADELTKDLREKEPGRFKYQKGKGGCAGVVFVVLIAIGLGSSFV